MANPDLCLACRTLFARQDIRIGRRRRYLHHTGGNSFQQALRAGCRICLMIWAGFGRPSILHETKLHVYSHGDRGAHVISIAHYRPEGGHVAALLLRPWSARFVRRREGLKHICTPGKQLSDSTGSDQSFDFLNLQYKNCRENHLDCTKPLSAQDLPSRLLDVGGRDQNSVSLVHKEEVEPGAIYATLSHCWGGMQPSRLTSSTDRLLRVGIPDSDMPKTFQHAVLVTRRLGFRYIWIDSLCIYQDDLEDWASQAASMQDIYQNAALNIAATAAINGSIGLFYNRDPKALEPLKVDIAWPFLTHNETRAYVFSPSLSVSSHVDEAPLNRRAWVMQERHLSRRIVHFTRDVVYWECCKTFANEIYPAGLPRSGGTGELVRHTRNLKRSLQVSYSDHLNKEQREGLYSAWQEFVGAYTKCQLTYEEDKIVALTGIAQRVSRVLQDDLVGGLWRSHFIKELCWVTDNRGDPKPSYVESKAWIAPSWSWQSLSSPIVMDDRRHSHDLAQLVEVEVSAKPSGALIDGHITLRCRLIPAILLPMKPLLGRDMCKIYFPDDTYGMPLFDSIGKLRYMLVESDRAHVVDPSGGTTEIYLLALVSSGADLQVLDNLRVWTNFDISITGISITSSTYHRNSFERVGVFHACHPGLLGYGDSFFKKLVEKYKNTQDQIIRLV